MSGRRLGVAPVSRRIGVVGQAVRRVVLVLLGLHGLAVEAALAGMAGLVTVLEDLVLLDHLVGDLGHRPRARALALGAGAEFQPARIRHAWFSLTLRVRARRL